MIEILCNGVVHYRRPSMDDPDVQECLQLIKWHELLAGGKSSYEVREVQECACLDRCPSTCFSLRYDIPIGELCGEACPCQCHEDFEDDEE